MTKFFAVTVLLFSVQFAATSPSLADETSLDAASAEALQKTQNLLKDPSAREKAIQESPDAQKADANLKALTNGDEAETQKLYGISSQVMGDLTKKSQGDPMKMQEMLEKAKQDPKAFTEGLSQESQGAIRDYARELERREPAGRGGARP